MATIQAIQTRYKHITYRSRAEARFAAFLDYNGRPFSYEPEFLRLPSGYVPDFAFFVPKMLSPGNELLCTFIEYKPSSPNSDYMASLQANVKEIAVRLMGIGFPKTLIRPALVVGSVFEAGKRSVLHYRPKEEGGGYRCESWDSLSRTDDETEAIEYAKSYRYDLED